MGTGPPKQDTSLDNLVHFFRKWPVKAKGLKEVTALVVGAKLKKGIETRWTSK